MPQVSAAPAAEPTQSASDDDEHDLPLLDMASVPGQCAFWTPERLVLSAWLGHIPFAFWIVAAQRPEMVVELGTDRGASYLAFCQAIDRLGLSTRAHAVDTWLGDDQAGFYGEEVFTTLRDYHDVRYARFSRLVRSTFDAAVTNFADGSIDLLHIDGFHTYEAVRHDFETWRPKLSDRAIVLFHDIDVRERDFGVWRLWDELTPQFPSFAFRHHHGLGVLAVGPVQSDAVRALLAVNEIPPAAAGIRECFARLGVGVQAEYDRLRLVDQLRLGELEQERLQREVEAHDITIGVQATTIAAQATTIERQERELGARAITIDAQLRELDVRAVTIGAREVEIATLTQQRDELTRELTRHQRKRKKLIRSLSWRITRPLRSIQSLQRRLFKSGRSDHGESIAEPSAAALDDRRGLQLTSVLPPSLEPFTTYALPEPFREAQPGARQHTDRPRICCLVHLYYTDLWEELAAYLRNLGDLPCDIYVNFVAATVDDGAVARVHADFPTAHVLTSPNRGRDAGGIFSLLALVDMAQYDVVLVLHGKRSVNLPEGHGDLWRRTLIDPLVGSPAVARLNVELMASDPSVGLIASASCCSTFAGNNAAMLGLLSARLGLPAAVGQPPYVAGAMFMVRPALIGELQRALRDLPFLDYEHAAARGAIDGQLEHAVERMYGTLTVARGLRIVWRDTRATEIPLGLPTALPPAPIRPLSSDPPAQKRAKKSRSALQAKIRQARKSVKRRLLQPAEHGPAIPRARTYQDWIAAYDTLTDHDRALIMAHIERLPQRPLISVVMPVYNADAIQLREAIDSVRAQLYPNWELCIADDASTKAHVRQVLDSYRADHRIKVVYRKQNGHIAAASNSALAMAEGEFVALMDHDDLLPAHALYEIAVVINDRPDAELIYSDEDRIDAKGLRQMAYFKPDWDPDLLLTHNMVCHLGAYRRSTLRSIGGFRTGYDGSQDYDLVLRFSRVIAPERIYHIPAVLYHWRINLDTSFSNQSLDKCVQAARRAISEHLDAQGLDAEVGASPVVPSNNRVRYALPAPLPLVSVIIPTRGSAGRLAECVEGVLRRTDYARLELIIVDSKSSEAGTAEFPRHLVADERIRLVPFTGPLNYSAMFNHAVEHATGEVILLLSNEAEVIDAGWLKEMVSQALRPDVGAVGAKLLYPNGTVQHAGMALGVQGAAFTFGHNVARDDPGYYGLLSAVRTISAVTSACLAVRRKVYLEVAGFDAANLQIAFNDVDFCLRVGEHGYRNVITPFAQLYLHSSISHELENDPDEMVRRRDELGYLQAKWRHLLDNDPYYSPNFELATTDIHGLGYPSRRIKPWTIRDMHNL